MFGNQYFLSHEGKHQCSSRASVLVANGNDPKLVQELLRHSNVKTTLDIYAKAMTPAKLEAQGWVLEQLLTSSAQSSESAVAQIA
jgi:integrase